MVISTSANIVELVNQSIKSNGMHKEGFGHFYTGEAGFKLGLDGAIGLTMHGFDQDLPES